MPIDSPGAASQHLPWPSVTDAARRRRPLTFEPFRGLRYAPERVEDLAAVTAPPYDTLDRAGVAALRATDPHNIVRIILPRATKPTRRPERAAAHDAGYDEARDLLARWRGDGVLVVDPEPALYVYEQVDGRPENRGSPAGVLRGLIGAVELRDPDERVVLPHEDVLPGPVQDRLALMRVTRANLEPILLVYQGGGTTTEIVEAVSATPPMVEAHGPDGTSYRLWRISDPQRLATIAQDLAPRQSLIADGHHRYAAYLRLREEMHAAGAGNGPWDAGLALLVDQRAHPLGIAAIHRTVTGRTLRDVVDAASGVFQVEMFGADGAAARKALAGCAGVAHALIATGYSSGSRTTERPRSRARSLRHAPFSIPTSSTGSSWAAPSGLLRKRSATSTTSGPSSTRCVTAAVWRSCSTPSTWPPCGRWPARADECHASRPRSGPSRARVSSCGPSTTRRRGLPVRTGRRGGEGRARSSSPPTERTSPTADLD